MLWATSKRIPHTPCDYLDEHTHKSSSSSDALVWCNEEVSFTLLRYTKTWLGKHVLSAYPQLNEAWPGVLIHSGWKLLLVNERRGIFCHDGKRHQGNNFAHPVNLWNWSRNIPFQIVYWFFIEIDE